jgi:pre-mRNA 3'-end-processing factor FIP1
MLEHMGVTCDATSNGNDSPGSKAAKAQKKEVASKAVKIEADKRSGTPARKEDAPRAGSAAPTAPTTAAAAPATVKGTLTYNGREGKDFPEVRTGQLDVDQIPTWTNGKPIIAVDIDADLAEHTKPWRLPGTDQTDYFNYGFDEYTWTQYCVRQQTMGGTISQLKQDDAQMKAFFGAGGAPGGGGGAQQQAGPPAMPPDMMGMDPQMMAQQMGVPVEFVQQMMQNGGMPPMGGPGMGGQQGGQQGFNSQGGGFGNDNSSPQPQNGQGFQPPSGPGGGQQNGMSMEGLSAQQMAIYQQEQQVHSGGGHRGGRNRRGRW